MAGRFDSGRAGLAGVLALWTGQHGPRDERGAVGRPKARSPFLYRPLATR
jgi:hypothetical protein